MCLARQEEEAEQRESKLVDKHKNEPPNPPRTHGEGPKQA